MNAFLGREVICMGLYSIAHIGETCEGGNVESEREREKGDRSCKY